MRHLALACLIFFAVSSIAADNPYVLSQKLTIYPEYPSDADLINFDYLVTVRDCGAESANVAVSGSMITVTMHRGDYGCIPEFYPRMYHAAIGQLRADTYSIRIVTDSPWITDRELLKETLVVAPAPVIERISPAVAAPGQRMVVAVKGKNLLTNSHCDATCTSTVWFGTEKGEIVNADQNTILVRTPEHSVGAVSVAVERSDHRRAVSKSEFAFGNISLSRYLIPFSGSSFEDGANGSRWAAALSLVNLEDKPVAMGIPDPLYRVFVRELNNTCWVGSEEPHGFFAYFPDPKLVRVSVSMVIWDYARSEKRFGTPIHVPREDEAISGPIDLVDIPTDARYRLTLRVYDFGGPRGKSFDVSAFGETYSEVFEPPELLAEVTAFTNREDFDVTYPDAPGYSEIDVTSAMPKITTFDRVRIRVTPVDFSAWALLTVTDNETHQVMAIEPVR